MRLTTWRERLAEQAEEVEEARIKVFLSYAWSRREHKQWVTELAEGLREHVLLSCSGATRLRSRSRSSERLRHVHLVAKI